MRGRTIFLAICFAAMVWPLSGHLAMCAPPDSTGRRMDRPIHVDIPVTLEKADVVFNMDHMAFTGDLSVGVNYMRMLSARFKEMKTVGHIIGIFHGDLAYLTLNDNAYNAFRKVSTGNPHKQLIADLLSQGVQIEECAVSMKNHGWGNEDLLPGVKVNSGATGRIVQLCQQGYVQMQP